MPDVLPIVLGLGLVGLFAALASADKGPSPGATPTGAGPFGLPTEPPEPNIPPSDGGFVGLGDRPTLARDLAILEAVKGGRAQAPTWLELDCSRGDHKASCFVSATPVLLPIRARIPARVPDFAPEKAPAALRERYAAALAPYAGRVYEGLCAVNVRHPVADGIAAYFGAYLQTSRISDLAWKQARPIAPQVQLPDELMAHTYRMIAHHLLVSGAVASAPSGGPLLVRPLGKDWATSNLVRPEKAVNFGWQTKGAAFKSPGGVPVLQPLSSYHDFAHVDYSQVITLVREDVRVIGEGTMSYAEALADPKTAALFSDEGPIATARHPLFTQAGMMGGGGLLT